MDYEASRASSAAQAAAHYSNESRTAAAAHVYAQQNRNR